MVYSPSTLIANLRAFIYLSLIGVRDHFVIKELGDKTSANRLR